MDFMAAKVLEMVYLKDTNREREADRIELDDKEL